MVPDNVGRGYVMRRALLVQLPIPQLNFGRQTGNVPLAAACLKQAAAGLRDVRVDVCPESLVTYSGDAALLDHLIACRADIVGFSVYGWNLDRSLYFAQRLKQAYGPRILFGGPEVTLDNPAVRSSDVDFLVYGDGEAAFVRLLSDPEFWARGEGTLTADDIFRHSPSPYPENLLEPDIETMVLLETQRGCPYHCGYCYYPKARPGIAYKDEALLLDAVRWSAEHRVAELYLLDPSLNTRPHLPDFLDKIRDANPDRRMAVVGEIRAEAIDRDLAARFAEAGFTWFEIGLQSVNPAALAVMNRRLDIPRFLNGVRQLKQVGITPRIDLIAGLPGDDFEGFTRTVDFVVEHDLQDDIQVFPLSVLPGTEYRRRSRELGLRYASSPPYTVIETAAFTREQMLLAFDYAEYRCDVTLHPWPDLDVAWRKTEAGGESDGPDVWVRIGDRRQVAKLVLDADRPVNGIERLASRLTHPYQVILCPERPEASRLGQALETITRINPHVPLEIVFLGSLRPPDVDSLADRVRLHRPHFLDIQKRFMFARPGNRAVLWTLVSRDRERVFQGDMKRQAFWWRESRLPELADLETLNHLDGVVVDTEAPERAVRDWQDRMAPMAEDSLPVCFAKIPWQNRWLRLTKAQDYYFGARS